MKITYLMTDNLRTSNVNNSTIVECLFVPRKGDSVALRINDFTPHEV